MKKLTKGFTLIELLVVIAIIGILSSVVLASLNSARQKARDARRISDAKNIQLALELYADSNGAYPTQAQGIQALVDGGFLAAFPVPPAGTDQADAEPPAYDYAGIGTGCTGYHIVVELEDDNAVLVGDADYDSTDANVTPNAPLASDCGGGTGFDGDQDAASPWAYDLTN